MNKPPKKLSDRVDGAQTLPTLSAVLCPVVFAPKRHQCLQHQFMKLPWLFQALHRDRVTVALFKRIHQHPRETHSITDCRMWLTSKNKCCLDLVATQSSISLCVNTVLLLLSRLSLKPLLKLSSSLVVQAQEKLLHKDLSPAKPRRQLPEL